MFATRDLPTCKMLIRKHAYIFMNSAAESRNVILHSIVRSDILFTSPLWQHWRNILYVHPFYITAFLMTCMDVIYPQ